MNARKSNAWDFNFLLYYFCRFSVALEFNKLTDGQKMIIKHWIRNTVDETIVEDAVKILESNKESVENMVANNAFMIKEMKEKVEKEGIEKGLEKERENSRLKDIGRVKIFNREPLILYSH